MGSWLDRQNKPNLPMNNISYPQKKIKKSKDQRQQIAIMVFMSLPHPKEEKY